jgi:hypothetical protein
VSGVANFLLSEEKMLSVSAFKERQKEGVKFQAELHNIHSVLGMHLLFSPLHVTRT